MRRSLQFAVVLLTATFAASTLYAQDHGHHKGNGQGSGSTGGATSSVRATSGTGGTTQGGHRSLSTVPSRPYVNPFNQQIHLNPRGTGCFNCGYSSYGGYAYSGYEGNYNPAGPTTTDRVLANGGTFNSINSTPDTQQPPAQDQQPMYIRPEYPTQYSNENATINTSTHGDVVSASSDSPAILIFKDGTNMTIHNYAIYGANIVVLTPERKKFPIAALDVAATEKANEAAGYELKLPAVFTTH
jgi:hypothetical protein